MSQRSVRRRCPLLGVSIIRGSTILQKPQKKKKKHKLALNTKSAWFICTRSFDNTHIIYCSIQ